MESLNSRSVLPPDLPYGSNWGHKIADFEFLPYISFIVAFIASECIKKYWLFRFSTFICCFMSVQQPGSYCDG